MTPDPMALTLTLFSDPNALTVTWWHWPRSVHRLWPDGIYPKLVFLSEDIETDRIPDPNVNDPELQTRTLARILTSVCMGHPNLMTMDLTMFWTRVTFALTQSPALMTFNFTRRQGMKDTPNWSYHKTLPWGVGLKEQEIHSWYQDHGAPGCVHAASKEYLQLNERKLSVVVGHVPLTREVN